MNSKLEFMNETFLWRKKGYFYRHKPTVDILDSAILNSDNPWHVLAGVLEQVKKGQNSSIDLLLPFLNFEDDPSLVASCLWLIGDAGKKKHMKYLVNAMEESRMEYIRIKACDAAKHAGYVWLLPHILDVWCTIRSREKYSISKYLSILMEPSAGLVFDYSQFDRDEEYVDFVNNKILDIKSTLGFEDAVIVYGREFVFKDFVEHMYELLVSGKKTGVLASEFGYLRHRFEAITGIDCSGFYKNEKFNQLETLAIIKPFLDEKTYEKYKDGVRYFFGKPVQ
jgi:hypothetical protein